MTTWWRRLRIVAQLLVDWGIFRTALDDMLRDRELRRRLDAVLAADPVLAANAAMLRALWAPIERGFRELR